MKDNTPLNDIFVVLNPGTCSSCVDLKVKIIRLESFKENNCGWPPVPVHADVATDVIPGKTTNVTYKCNDPFVLDPNRPQFSTCNQLTGRWTAVPKCICAVPPVPANAKVVQRLPFSVRFRCVFGYRLTGEDIVTCDEKGTWNRLPSCKFN